MQRHSVVLLVLVIIIAGSSLIGCGQQVAVGAASPSVTQAPEGKSSQGTPGVDSAETEVPTFSPASAQPTQEPDRPGYITAEEAYQKAIAEVKRVEKDPVLLSIGNNTPISSVDGREQQWLAQFAVRRGGAEWALGSVFRYTVQFASGEIATSDYGVALDQREIDTLLEPGWEQAWRIDSPQAYAIARGTPDATDFNAAIKAGKLRATDFTVTNEFQQSASRLYVEMYADGLGYILRVYMDPQSGQVVKTVRIQI